MKKIRIKWVNGHIVSFGESLNKITVSKIKSKYDEMANIIDEVTFRLWPSVIHIIKPPLVGCILFTMGITSCADKGMSKGTIEANLVVLELSAENMKVSRELGYKIPAKDLKEADSLVRLLDGEDLEIYQLHRLERVRTQLKK